MKTAAVNSRPGIAALAQKAMNFTGVASDGEFAARDSMFIRGGETH
jgi:hypothetical protein